MPNTNQAAAAGGAAAGGVWTALAQPIADVAGSIFDFVGGIIDNRAQKNMLEMQLLADSIPDKNLQQTLLEQVPQYEEENKQRFIILGGIGVVAIALLIAITIKATKKQLS